VSLLGRSWEDLEAEGLCECGQPSDPQLHPPLEAPKPMGRPIETRLAIPRYGPIVRGEAAQSNFQRRKPTERLLEVLRILSKHHGHRAAAAAELGISAPTVHAALRRARALGLEVPPGHPGVAYADG